MSTTTIPPGESTEIARAERGPAVITTREDFRQSLSTWRSQAYHVLTPIADFRALPPQWALMPAQVAINTDLAAGEVYVDRLWCKEGEVALTKLGLAKIASAAGMSVRTVRTDPRTIPNLWEVRATARFIGVDGTPQELDATEELDLRDGTARAERIMGRDRSVLALQAVRAKGLRNCEARAINAAVRQFGIKQKYTTAELAKPFVILRVVYQPDLADPEVRRMFAARALQGSSSSVAALPPAEEPRLEDEHREAALDPATDREEVVGEVPSESIVGARYTITRRLATGALRCTCPAFAYSKTQPQTCKHIARFNERER